MVAKLSGQQGLLQPMLDALQRLTAEYEQAFPSDLVLRRTHWKTGGEGVFVCGGCVGGCFGVDMGAGMSVGVGRCVCVCSDMNVGLSVELDPRVSLCGCASLCTCSRGRSR